MNLYRIVAVSTLASSLVLSTYSISQSATPVPPQVISVSLAGEADSPMTIKLNAATAKAGMVEFDVTNDAIGTDHEVVLVKLKKPDQKIAVNPTKDRIDESKLKSMGEVAGLNPGATGILKVKLAAGDYLLLCNHKSHYKMGMYTPFTVVN
jgi:uncharacterized cupredoxin-like copper-binding protein